MKKRLMFFVNSLYGGGAERVLQTLLANLDYSTYDVTLYCLKDEDLNENYPSQVTKKYVFGTEKKSATCIKNLCVKMANKLKLMLYRHTSPRLFYRLFVRGNYDTEVAFIEGYATRIISGATKKDTARRVAWVHIDLVQNHWTSQAYQNENEEVTSYQQYDEIVCVSEQVRDSFKQLFPSTKNVTVRLNPIDEQRILRRAAMPMEAPLFQKGPVTLVTSGRLVPQKGYDRLLPIVKTLKDEGLRFVLNILGDGPDRPRLEQYIQENELQDVVRLVGFCENPFPCLVQSDLFVCSSRSEGYSTVVSEALIVGLPVVTTDCAGMREMLGDNEFGIVTENNPDALLAALRQILSDASLLQHYKEKAVERSKMFSLKNYMANIERAF